MAKSPNIRCEIKDLSNSISQTRRFLHQNPELSGEEWQTQRFILDFLQAEGIECSPMAQTGVVGTIYGELEGECIGLRADMDALPVNEIFNHNYGSKRSGIAHACGHDGHMTILLYTAKLLQAARHRLKGQVRLIFQPAEENIGGAERMIAEGCLKNPDVKEVYGIHLWSSYPVGEIRSKIGPIMSTNNEIRVCIKGKSGHGAMPHLAVDSIVVASQFITNLQAVVARNISPFASTVISFGTIEGGTAPNVIAPEVNLRGTIRAMSDEDKAYLIQRIEEVLQGTAKAHLAEATLEVISEGAYITLVNHPIATAKALSCAQRIVGADQVLTAETMGAEDFAYYAKEVPSSFIFIGAGNLAKGICHAQHHCSFDIDELSLEIGIELFMQVSGL